MATVIGYFKRENLHVLYNTRYWAVGAMVGLKQTPVITDLAFCFMVLVDTHSTQTLACYCSTLPSCVHRVVFLVIFSCIYIHEEMMQQQSVHA